jgi:hypothetical protein
LQDLVSALDLKPNQKAIMIGTPEHQIAAMNAPKESKQEEVYFDSLNN